MCLPTAHDGRSGRAPCLSIQLSISEVNTASCHCRASYEAAKPLSLYGRVEVRGAEA